MVASVYTDAKESRYFHFCKSMLKCLVEMKITAYVMLRKQKARTGEDPGRLNV